MTLMLQENVLFYISTVFQFTCQGSQILCVDDITVCSHEKNLGVTGHVFRLPFYNKTYRQW